MTINSISNNTINMQTAKTALKTGVGGTSEADSGDSELNDSIAMTDVAKNIKHAFESSPASATSAVDYKRVAAVKQALSDGSYAINADSVAKKMIQFEKQIPQENST